MAFRQGESKQNINLKLNKGMSGGNLNFIIFHIHTHHMRRELLVKSFATKDIWLIETFETILSSKWWCHVYNLEALILSCTIYQAIYIKSWPLSPKIYSNVHHPAANPATTATSASVTCKPFPGRLILKSICH